MVTEPHTSGLPAALSRLYPFSPRSFTTGPGARMSFLDEGPRSDEAVLMLHGNPTWSFYYRDLVRDLSGSLRCIVPDHVGMGLSSRPAAYAYTLEQRIADIEGLVEALGLRRVHLVVHDWGGAVGFGYATRHPDLVGRIVILNTAAFRSDRIPFRIRLCRLPYFGAFLVRGLNGFADPATWMAMKTRRLTWDERRGYLYPYGSWRTRQAVHQFVRDIPMEANHPTGPVLDSVASALPRLAGKNKLIVWGGRDFCFDDTFLSRWRETFPDAHVERLEHAGHYVLEDGGAPVRAMIRDFLLNNTQ